MGRQDQTAAVEATEENGTATATPELTVEERRDIVRAGFARLDARDAERAELQARLANFDRETSDVIEGIVNAGGGTAFQRGKAEIVFKQRKDKANPTGAKLWIVQTPRAKKNVFKV
jgi:hypothetical protein